MLAKNPKTKRRGVLLYSGGIDSTISSIILACKEVELIGLSINYPGRPRGELLAAKTISKMLPFSEFIEVSLSSNTLLTDPNYVSTSFEGWIPYRNLLFWSIAAHKAMLRNADFIAGGHCDDDEKVFTDASRDFFNKLADLLTFSGHNKFSHSLEIELPMFSLTDERLYAIINTGDNKELLYKTWSCWRDNAKPCQHCFACKEHRKFFNKLERIN